MSADRITRRSMVATAAAGSVAALATPPVSAVQPVDPHIAWGELYRAAVAEFNETEDDDVFDESMRLRDLICFTEAKTLAGVYEQLMMLADVVRGPPGDAELNAWHHARQTVSHLAVMERLAREGRP